MNSNNTENLMDLTCPVVLVRAIQNRRFSKFFSQPTVSNQLYERSSNTHPNITKPSPAQVDVSDSCGSACQGRPSL